MVHISGYQFWLYHSAGRLGFDLRQAEWLSFNDRFDDALDVPPLRCRCRGGWGGELGAELPRKWLAPNPNKNPRFENNDVGDHGDLPLN